MRRNVGEGPWSFSNIKYCWQILYSVDLRPNWCHWISWFSKYFLPRHYLWRLKGLVAAQMWTGLNVPKGKSDIFWQAQVLSILLQCFGAFCQTGRKESVFGHKSACNLVPDRIINHTPETFNKLRVPNLLAEGSRIYLQFAIFLQAATWRNSSGTSVILHSLQLLSLPDPDLF